MAQTALLGASNFIEMDSMELFVIRDGVILMQG